MAPRHFLDIDAFDAPALAQMMAKAHEMKADLRSGSRHFGRLAEGKVLAGAGVEADADPERKEGMAVFPRLLFPFFVDLLHSLRLCRSRRSTGVCVMFLVVSGAFQNAMMASPMYLSM